ncbi:MAG: hypothetical protein IAE78_20130 [Myxococcus sp.]|nr:hypothetical protein [Myxococcus sp.]
MTSGPRSVCAPSKQKAPGVCITSGTCSTWAVRAPSSTGTTRPRPARVSSTASAIANTSGRRNTPASSSLAKPVPRWTSSGSTQGETSSASGGAQSGSGWLQPT